MKLPKWVAHLHRSGRFVVQRSGGNEGITTPATWQGKVGDWMIRTGYELRGRMLTAPAKAGKRLRFVICGSNLGKPIYEVQSIRGGFAMGRIEWSNQWRVPRFVPDKEAVFDRESVAEIYACLRDFK